MATTYQARTVKYAADLIKARTLEKLEIERRYWQARRVDWGIVTDQQASIGLAQNVKWFYWSKLDERIASIQAKSNGKIFSPPNARGFAIVGISGMGKTTAVANILSLYPQVITHGRYRQQDLILQQIVWLKLDCPLDGSTKGLCLNFFQAVDDLLGTDYYDRYTGGGGRTVDDLLPRMARVASLHCLGVLVIDEIQNLSEAKSGGSARMLNFFVQLENTIGVPFILIRTPKAIPALSGEFRHARRATEQRDVYWERMKETTTDTGGGGNKRADPVWEEFIRALWDYQYLRQKTPLKASSMKQSGYHYSSHSAHVWRDASRRR